MADVSAGAYQLVHPVTGTAGLQIPQREVMSAKLGRGPAAVARSLK
jgi:hypothetical protein